MEEHRTTWIIRFLKRCFLVYVVFTFFGVFLLLFPFFLLAIVFKADRFALLLTRYWSNLFFTLIGIKIVIENKQLLDKRSTYIFCPNHFSFLDIASMPSLPILFKFVGKVSLSTIPLFGFYFRKIHITVDREKLKSRYATFNNSLEALKKGYSLTVFPEGGIYTTHGTALSRFKEGPFRMALETGISLVPVTIADNWNILPDDGKFMIQWKRKSRFIIHEPIDPSKYTRDDLKEFQAEVYNIIQTELDRRNPHGERLIKENIN